MLSSCLMKKLEIKRADAYLDSEIKVSRYGSKGLNLYMCGDMSRYFVHRRDGIDLPKDWGGQFMMKDLDVLISDDMVIGRSSIGVMLKAITSRDLNKRLNTILKLTGMMSLKNGKSITKMKQSNNLDTTSTNL